MDDFPELIDDFSGLNDDFAGLTDDFPELIDAFPELIDEFPRLNGELRELNDDFRELNDDLPSRTTRRSCARTAPRPPEIRDFMAYADAYSPLADELEVLAKFVRYSVTAARNKAGNEALTTYSLAQRLAKHPENASLAPYVADMRRALGRVRKPTPEALAEKAAERAAKAAAKAAKQAPKALPPVTTTQQPS